MRLTLCFSVLFAAVAVNAARMRPTVLMHGLTASSDKLDGVKGWIEADYPGMYVKNVEIGDGSIDSIFWGLEHQVAEFARQIRADPELKDGFNAIGHSQGGIITRAYVAFYNDPPVHNLIAWSGPEGGVFGIPEINSLICNDTICPLLDEIADDLINGRWTEQVMQDNIGPAAYWRDPYNLTDYAKLTLLAKMNNEIPNKNKTVKENMLKLNLFATAKADKDYVVIPPSAAWFNFFADNSNTTVIDYKDSEAYKEDWIGLKTLDESKRWIRWEVPCKHGDYPRESCKPWSYNNLVRSLLNNTLPSA